MSDEPSPEACIFVLATPIGNLEDISLRAKRVLSDCDLIACEDTRVTQKLLSLLELKKKTLISYHDKTEQKKAAPLLEKIKLENLQLVLVSDAGTPLISDPGYHLIRLAHEEKIPVIPIPGPSALTSLVSCSGLPSTKLFFTGFLPKKENQKRDELKSWPNLKASVVFFESALRLVKTLEMLLEEHPSSEVCLGKELTKRHELIMTAPGSEVLEYAKTKLTLKGEYVLMVHIDNNKELSDEDKLELVREALKNNPKTRVKDLSQSLKEKGLSSKEAYDLILQEKNS